MTADEKPERHWRDIAEELMKATDAAEILLLSQKLTRALDEAKKEKPFQQ